MKTFKKLALLTSLTALIISPLNRHLTGVAGAWTGAIPACNVEFGSFNWKDEIKNHTANTNKRGPDDVNTVLIYRYVGQSTTAVLVELIYEPSLAAFTQGARDPISNLTPKSVERNHANSASQVGDGWTVDFNSKTVTKNHQVQITPAISKNGSNGSGNTTELACISTAKGFTQPYAWDQVAVSSSVPAQGKESCTALDFGCWIGRAFNGIGDGFNAVAQAIIKALAWLWSPDQWKTKKEFDSLKAFLDLKLGFLVYPLEFLAGVFSAFGDTSNNWCTTSSCSKNFGNLFGSPLVINFNQGAVTTPTLWAWFLGITRGLVVFGLIMAIRKKYFSVVHK